MQNSAINSFSSAESLLSFIKIELQATEKQKQIVPNLSQQEKQNYRAQEHYIKKPMIDIALG